jgi:hypothetical protein
MLKGHGCENYQGIAIGDEQTGHVLETCADLCSKTSGCVGFGFQQSSDCMGAGSGKDGACYLWKEKCIPVENECWTQYGPIVLNGNSSQKTAVVTDAGLLPNLILSNAPSASIPYQVEVGIGCTNWADIRIGDTISNQTVKECSDLCQKESGCVGFGYQESGDCPGQGQSAKGCMLFSGACDRSNNPCWSQYGEVSEASIALHHMQSLYCWAVFKQNTYEVDLIENQFERQMGIFNWECDGRALLTDADYHLEASDGRTLDAINMGSGSLNCEKLPGNSWANTGIFQHAWQAVIDHGEYALYDWIIKVDADSVFRPQSFKWHAGPGFFNLNPDDRIYFKNFFPQYPVVGAIEVASRPVLQAMAQDPPGCNNIWVPAEDDWFVKCMDHHSAYMVDDSALLQHCESDGRCHPEGGRRCGDSWFVTIHPYKDVGGMNWCADQLR